MHMCVNVFVYICMNVFCVCEYMYVYVCVYVCVFAVCICVCMRVFMCVWLYVYLYVSMLPSFFITFYFSCKITFESFNFVLVKQICMRKCLRGWGNISQ